jgi:hypothetical protein
MATDWRSARLNPIILVLGASALSGGLGYIATIVVAANIGASAYSLFAVFWSALYLLVGTFGGVQQEVTRAASLKVAQSPVGAARQLAAFSVGLAAIIFAATWVVAFSTGRGVFAEDAVALALPLATAVASYILVAALAGALYGVRRWEALAVMIAIDGVLRLVAILIAVGFDSSIELLAWAVAVPFPLAVLIVFPVVAGRLGRELRVDVGHMGLSWNIARTVVGAAATALLISGFPLVIKAFSRGESTETMGALVLTLTLTRAPIVIPLLALQSYFIVRFSEKPQSAMRRSLRIAAVVFVAAVGIALLGALVGPAILRAVFGEEFLVSEFLIFGYIASSGLIAALCVTGPATLAMHRHTSYASGWVTAAGVALMLMLLPGDLALRTTIALTVGPIAGLVVHIFAMFESNRSSG